MLLFLDELMMHLTSYIYEMMMLKGHAPSCMVLVIDDNLYGLMVCLSYTLRFVHRHCLKNICWLQGWKEKIKCWPRWYSWSYPKIGHVVSVEHIASMSWRRRLCEHSCVPSRHHLNEECWKDSRLIKTKCKEWNQVDQHTKHRRCTMWDHVISWYGKHCPLCFVY